MPSGRFAAQRFDERQHDLTHGHRVFAGLDVHVGHTVRAMFDEQFGDLFRLRAVAGEVAIVTAHATVAAIFAAEIRNFDDGTHENFFAKLSSRRGDRAFVQGLLCRAVQSKFRLGGKMAVT